MRNSVYTKRYARFLHALKKARLSAKLTQLEAAKLLKQHQSFVSKCESGERRVDAVELDEFCKIYNIGIERIFKIIGEEEAKR